MDTVEISHQEALLCPSAGGALQPQVPHAHSEELTKVEISTLQVSFSRSKLLETDSSICCRDVHIFIRLQITVLANPFNQKYNKLHLVIFMLGELVTSSITFEKGTFPPHHEHNVPLTAAAAFTCPVQNQRAH